MFRVFEAENADAMWQLIGKAFREGEGSRQNSRNGPMTEILHAALCIRNPRQRWLLSRRPALNPAFSIAEVVWIVTGRQDAAFLNYFNRQLPKYAGSGTSYHGAYGHRLRHRMGVDQLQRAYDVLRQDPDNRQVVLQIWDPRVDLPGVDAESQDRDIPCNVTSLLKVRNGLLEWTQIMRSNDVFRGLPHNIVQFTCLQEIMAGWLGLGVGGYHQISDSLHLYDVDAAKVYSSLPIGDVQNTDDLTVPKAKSEALFAELSCRGDRIIDQSTAAKDVAQLALWPEAPSAYQNMLRLVCAEGARRRNHYDLAAAIASGCTNPALKSLWCNWEDRMAVAKSGH